LPCLFRTLFQFGVKLVQLFTSVNSLILFHQFDGFISADVQLLHQLLDFFLHLFNSFLMLLL
jgi:hypothetical protein